MLPQLQQLEVGTDDVIMWLSILRIIEKLINCFPIFLHKVIHFQSGNAASNHERLKASLGHM